MARLMILPQRETVMYQDLDDGNYNSITDFLEAVKQGPRNNKNHEEWDSMFNRSPGGRGWFGTGIANGLEVQRLVSEGWQEGRDRMNELRSKMGTIDIAPVDRRRRMTRTDHGDILDIHQVYAGRLDVAWQKPMRRTMQGPQKIELCANMICSGGEHADVLFWRGAAAVTLADLLEAAGYMVRLVVCFGGRNFSERRNEGAVSCRIIVKDHGMPLDVTSTSAVILPGFFRSIGHAWIAAHATSKIGSAGISVQQGKVEEKELLLTHNVMDHGTALAFVNDTIEQINNGSLNEAA